MKGKSKEIHDTAGCMRGTTLKARVKMPKAGQYTEEEHDGAPPLVRENAFVRALTSLETSFPRVSCSLPPWLDEIHGTVTTRRRNTSAELGPSARLAARPRHASIVPSLLTVRLHLDEQLARYVTARFCRINCSGLHGAWFAFWLLAGPVYAEEFCPSTMGTMRGSRHWENCVQTAKSIVSDSEDAKLKFRESWLLVGFVCGTW